MRHDWKQADNLVRCAVCGQYANPKTVDLATFPEDCKGRVVVAARPVSQTAVVVISHNYGRFLGDAIQSVLDQSLAAAEILVVDDASDDNTAQVAAQFADKGVKYLRIEARHVHLARMAGLANTSAPFIVFLDADDELPRDYIRFGELRFTDSAVGVVFSDIEEFGAHTGRTRYQLANIESRNFIHSASIARRHALTSINLPQDGDDLPTQSHSDWFVWREILRAGWKAAKSTEALWYRKHPDSMLANTTNETYRERANLDLETVQIVIPLAGRRQYWDRLVDWVELQSWRRGKITVVDTSDDAGFRRNSRRWTNSLPCETQWLGLPPTGPAADKERRNRPVEAREVSRLMPTIYNAVRPRLTSEYVFWLEDDVLPDSLDVISRLMDSMGPDVACVSGLVPSRWEPNRVMVWDRDIVIQQGRGRGVTPCWGTGFGCLLVRKSAIDLQPFHSGGRTGNYDQEFAQTVDDAGLKWLIDWEAGCDHAGVSSESVVRRG